MSTLKDKAIKGVVWSLIERFGNQGIQFIIGLVLARLLMPEDYGLIGMILVFISLAQVFVEGGFSAALIRKSNPSKEDYSTVFWFNLIAAVVCYTALFFSSPLIAHFFNEPQLVIITKVVGLNIIINSFSIIQKTILTKELNFKSQAIINLVSILLSGFIALYFAFEKYGVWALVIQSLSRNIIMSFAYWYFGKWRPIIVFYKSSFKDLFKFGYRLTLAIIFNVIYENLNSMIIGKLFNASNLGYYTRANQFQKLPVSSIYGAVGAVSYPVLAELQTNHNNLKNGYRTMIKLTAFILFPVMAILASISEPMINTVLTEKWSPSIRILQLLCIVGALYPLHAINIEILKIKGRTDLIFKLQIIKQSFHVILIFIFYRWGIYGLVIGEIILNLFSLFINTIYSKKLIDFGLFEQIKDIFVFIIISLVTAGLIVFLNNIIHNPYFQFTISPFIGLLFYFTISKLFKIKEFQTIIETASKYYLKISNSFS